ncbi:MAG: cupin domain-containing protein [Sedimentisphaerales bacterium]|nr:cupin domain-containing protein [Sedimentisphaerales bacterium]
MISAEQIVTILGMMPLSMEGGFYVETYRSKEILPKNALPHRYPSERNICTAILYLLTADSCSMMHRLRSDEIFHFYFGDPVEMLLLYPDGHDEVVVLGQDLNAGQRIQMIVPHGVWQGAVVIPLGKYALLGSTVSPGFEYEDFELGKREELTLNYPQQRNRIMGLT